jgi:hypothetical protein
VGYTQQPVTWTDATNIDRRYGPAMPIFYSGQGALVGARVFTLERPIGIVVTGIPYHRRSTALTRFQDRLPWNRRDISASTSSQSQ